MGRARQCRGRSRGRRRDRRSRARPRRQARPSRCVLLLLFPALDARQQPEPLARAFIPRIFVRWGGRDIDARIQPLDLGGSHECVDRSSDGGHKRLDIRRRVQIDAIAGRAEAPPFLSAEPGCGREESRDVICRQFNQRFGRLAASLRHHATKRFLVDPVS